MAKKTITVEEVADYLRQSEDFAHYEGDTLAEDAMGFAVKLVRLHGLCTAEVERRTK